MMFLYAILAFVVSLTHLVVALPAPYRRVAPCHNDSPRDSQSQTNFAVGGYGSPALPDGLYSISQSRTAMMTVSSSMIGSPVHLMPYYYNIGKEQDFHVRYNSSRGTYTFQSTKYSSFLSYHNLVMNEAVNVGDAKEFTLVPSDSGIPNMFQIVPAEVSDGKLVVDMSLYRGFPPRLVLRPPNPSGAFIFQFLADIPA